MEMGFYSNTPRAHGTAITKAPNEILNIEQGHLHSCYLEHRQLTGHRSTVLAAARIAASFVWLDTHL